MVSFVEHFDRMQLYPLTLTRDIADTRMGIFSNRDRWEMALQGFGLPVPLTIDASIIPSFQFLKNTVETGLQTAIEKTDTFKRVSRLWEMTAWNGWCIMEDLQLLALHSSRKEIPKTVNLTGPSAHLFIEEGAQIEPVFINTLDGPVHIGKHAYIMQGACLRGPLSIGQRAVVKMGAQIYGGTSIGAHCVVGGEIKNSIFYPYSNKAHEGYIGDSVIGAWCNIGAGTTCSNLRNTASPVKVWHAEKGAYDMAGLKCGLYMGDHSRTSILCAFNSGSVVGVSANILQRDHLLPKHIPSFSWGGSAEKYVWEKAIEHIRNWMDLKSETLGDNLIKTLENIYKHST